MTRSVGRPLKYTRFILELNDEELFTPAAIADKGKDLGFYEEFLEDSSFSEVRRKIRHALARLSQNHKFPTMGDGMLDRKGQQPQRAWFGWRWKLAVKPGAQARERERLEVKTWTNYHVFSELELGHLHESNSSPCSDGPILEPHFQDPIRTGIQPGPLVALSETENPNS